MKAKENLHKLYTGWVIFEAKLMIHIKKNSRLLMKSIQLILKYFLC